MRIVKMDSLLKLPIQVQLDTVIYTEKYTEF